MGAPVDLSPIVSRAPAFMRATGWSREKANEVLCLFAGVETLYALDAVGVAAAAAYMDSVIGLCESHGELEGGPV